MLVFFAGFLFMFFIPNPKSSEVGTFLLIISVVLIFGVDFGSRFACPIRKENK